MRLILATQDNASSIMELIELCIKDLKSQGIYQWNNYYPTLNHIKESTNDKSMYILSEDENCLGTISITENQPSEYNKIDWLDKTGKKRRVYFGGQKFGTYFSLQNR